MADGTWSVADAKARFSELIEMALAEGPQRVTRHGKNAVVVVSHSEWARLAQPVRSVVDVLLDPAIRGGLEGGEDPIFARDHADDRPSPES
jgi:prevent-host-death family protein